MPTKEEYEKNKQYYTEYNKYRRTNFRLHLNELVKKYSYTEKGTKNRRINHWRSRGVICEDWDELYDYYMLTSNCEYCNVELINGYVGINRKCLDHNHETGEVRGIICHKCNSLDVFKNC